MTLLERWSLHVASLLVGLTGLLYGWLRYFGQRAGEFGLEPHPLQALLQHLHVLTAPVLVFTLGLVVKVHVLPLWRRGRASGRPSGVVLALIMGPMVMAGYLVQVATDPTWRGACAWVHGLASLLFLLGYAVHLFMPARAESTATEAPEPVSLNPS